MRVPGRTPRSRQGGLDASGGRARKGKFRHIRRRLACRIAQVGRSVARSTDRIAHAGPRRTRRGRVVPMLDSGPPMAKLAADVTDRPGGRAAVFGP